MNSREVVIFNHDGKENWESTLIRGALWYRGVPSKVLPYACLNEVPTDACAVILGAEHHKEPSLPSFQNISREMILAGRVCTYEFLQKKLLPKKNQILVYGEPYAIIPRLAEKERLMNRLMGSPVLGSLLNPRYYRMPTLKESGTQRPTFLLTSLGCQKKCGYCSYGATFLDLYGKDFMRRSRPWKSIAEEICDSMGKGTDHFVLVADQFFAKEPEENRELDLLARRWHSGKIGKPTLIFTVSPVELLNNRRAFESMNLAFELSPRLSIDSLENKTLELFGLDFDAHTALQAVQFLSSLKLSFRINYIFVRPGATVKGIQEEFNNLLSLAAMTSYMTPHQKLLLAQDIFSESLRIVPCSPLSFKEIAKKLITEKQKAIFTKIISSINEALEKEQIDPLMNIIEAVQKR